MLLSNLIYSQKYLNSVMVRLIYSILFLLYFLPGYCESSIIDSLEQTLNNNMPDTQRVFCLNELCWEYKVIGGYNKGLFYGKQAESISRKKNLEKLLSTTCTYMGICFYKMGDYSNALKYHKEGLELKEKLKLSEGIAISLGHLATLYSDISDYTKAIDYHLKSLNIWEKSDNKGGLSITLYNTGTVYEKLGDYTNALSFYTRSLKIREELGNKKGTCYPFIGIANVYFSQKKYDLALEFLLKAINIAEEFKENRILAYTLTDIGSVYDIKGNIEKAITSKKESMNLFNLQDDKQGMAKTNLSLSESYYKLNDFQSALQYALSGLKLAKELTLLADQARASNQLYIIYKKLNKIKDALYYHERFQQINDSIYNEENREKIGALKTKYALEQQEGQLKAKAEAEKEKINSMAAAERKKKNIIITATGSGLFMLIFFSGLLLKRFRVTNRQKNIIEQQKDILLEKNKSIQDSINYAKRIQEALLPFEGRIEGSLKDFFILYKPKDVVSGDFYWFLKKNEKIIIAAVDCTGHGVPGAFMSMIANGLLNDIVGNKGVTEPDIILNELNKGVRMALKQEETSSRDGMDIALCTINIVERIVDYSGANNPLWIVNDKGEFTEIQPNKQGIGGLKDENEKPFNVNSIQLKEPVNLYLFTDGFADQFGGPKGKKFKYKQMRDIILTIASQPMKNQKNILNEAFEEWKGNLEQVDDVCIVGLRI